MTNEQRESIDYLKESVLIYKNTIPKISDAIDTVLSLIKEQEKYIKDANDITEEMNGDIMRLIYELKQKDKQIELMAESIELQQYANIDTSNLDLVCEKLKCNKKCELVEKDCIKQYFERKVEDG